MKKFVEELGFEIPEEWNIVKLEEIIHKKKKSGLKVEDADNKGNYPFFTSGMCVFNHSEYCYEGKNIYISTGGSFYVRFYDGRASASNDVLVISCKKNVNDLYLYYTLEFYTPFINTYLFYGTGLKHLQKKYFWNLLIPLPPLPEQKKIAEILSTIDKKLEFEKKRKKRLEKIKKQMMYDLLTGRKRVKVNDSKKNK